jgi:putative transposase
VPKSHADMVAAVFRTIFAQRHAEAVSDTWDEVRDQLTRAFPKIGPLMDEAKTEVLAFTAFPRAHWLKIWSANPLERVNKQLKRRARVVGIFPNPASVIRLMGAVLADVHDEWHAGDRRYRSEGFMALLCRTAILEQSPRSTAATRHRGSTSKPTTPRGTAQRRGRSTPPRGA